MYMFILTSMHMFLNEFYTVDLLQLLFFPKLTPSCQEADLPKMQQVLQSAAAAQSEVLA